MDASRRKRGTAVCFGSSLVRPEDERTAAGEEREARSDVEEREAETSDKVAEDEAE